MSVQRPVEVLVYDGESNSLLRETTVRVSLYYAVDKAIADVVRAFSKEKNRLPGYYTVCTKAYEEGRHWWCVRVTDHVAVYSLQYRAHVEFEE